MGPLTSPNPRMKCMDCGHVTSGVELIQGALQARDLFSKGTTWLNKGNLSGEAFDSTSENTISLLKK